MLYNSGNQFNQIYYNGKPVSQIWKNGVCIYPTGILDLRAVLFIGFDLIPYSSGTVVTNVVWSTVPPSAENNAVYLSRTPKYVNPSDILGYLTTYTSSVQSSKASASALEPTVTLAYYNEHKKYSVGDVIINWEHIHAYADNGKYSINPVCYTCIVDMITPESYNESHWVVGYYPRLHGVYSSSETYNPGDIVLFNDTIQTCIIPIDYPEEFNSSHWVVGYYPKITGVYIPSRQYNIGDTVLYQDNNTIYTAYIVTTQIPTEYGWISGYYPEVTGYFNYSTSYNVGDIVVYYYNNDYRIYTSRWPDPHAAHYPNNRSNYWQLGYYPSAKWQVFPKNLQYNFKVGDIVASSLALGNYDSIIPRIVHTAPPLWYYPEDEDFLLGWIQDNILYLYCRLSSVRCCGAYFAISFKNVIDAEVADIDFAARFDVSGLVELEGQFANYATISNIDSLSAWDTHNVVYMNSIFYKCSNISSLLPLKHWNTSNVITLLCAFADCASITSLDGLENWDVNKVCDLSGAFSRCTLLTDISALYNWNTRSLQYITYIGLNTLWGLFQECTSLRSLHGLENWDVSKITNMEAIFYNCTSLIDISALSAWDTSAVTDLGAKYGSFYNCTSLPSLHGLETWDISKVTSLAYTFTNCSSLLNLDGLENWNTSNVTTMESTFIGCSSLSDISALSRWDTSNLEYLGHTSSGTSGYGMFQNCTSLLSIEPLANWDTSSVISIAHMFENDAAITRIHNLHWDLSSCTDFNYVFYNCTGITQISELYWTNIRQSFGSDCFTNLTSLVVADLSRCTSTDPSGYSGGSYLFYQCPNLEICDVGTIITSAGFGIWGATNADFGGCSKLSTLIIRNTVKVFDRSYYYGYGDGLSNLIANHGKVYVPQSLLADYLSSDAWINLTNQGVEILPLEGSPYEQPGSVSNLYS